MVSRRRARSRSIRPSASESRSTAWKYLVGMPGLGVELTTSPGCPKRLASAGIHRASCSATICRASGSSGQPGSDTPTICVEAAEVHPDQKPPPGGHARRQIRDAPRVRPGALGQRQLGEVAGRCRLGVVGRPGSRCSQPRREHGAQTRASRAAGVAKRSFPRTRAIARPAGVSGCVDQSQPAVTARLRAPWPPVDAGKRSHAVNLVTGRRGRSRASTVLVDAVSLTTCASTGGRDRWPASAG